VTTGGFAPGPSSPINLPPNGAEPLFDLGANLPPPIAARPALTPIERLSPGSDLHAKVLQKLLDRLEASERKMSNFYSRWRLNEKKMQAYVDLPQYEQLLKSLAVRGAEPPPIVSITVPYTFATIWTIVTYLAHTFTGRKPIFQVSTNKAEMVQAAENMEVVLQYNSDHTRLIKELFQYFLDGEMYGIGVIRTLWKVERKSRTTWIQAPVGGSFMPDAAQVKTRVREKKTVYEGNVCKTQDPFMFFPDPRVPMNEVNKRGEFVFWRTYEGEHTMKKEEADGTLKWVKDAKKTMPPNTMNGGGESARNLTSLGDAHAGTRDSQDSRLNSFFQVDQGTVELIPADWGLSDETDVQKWIFTILNKSQIVQAEALDLDHDMHPVAVIEPYSFGYGFGQVGLTDMLGPLQDTVSWFINSHIHNVRSTLNNSFIVNPSAVEMQDLKNPGPGKLIRLKPSAYGVDVRTIIQQLQVTDVTRSHVADMAEFIRMGDSLAAVNDNLRGIQTVGGRKTATEVRTSGEAGASRLAAHARLISAQGIVDLTEQMCLNNQQNLSEDFYVKVVGMDGVQDQGSRLIRPEDLVGDFYFPIHDGTLPIDKIATLDIWREIMVGVLQDPQLRQSYDVGKLFEFVAELGGARNITQFKLAPAEQIEAQMQAGNGVAPPGMMPGGGPQGMPPGMPPPSTPPGPGGGGIPPQMMQMLASLGGAGGEL